MTPLKLQRITVTGGRQQKIRQLRVTGGTRFIGKTVKTRNISARSTTSTASKSTSECKPCKKNKLNRLNKYRRK
jgi:hypothetical protein